MPGGGGSVRWGNGEQTAPLTKLVKSTITSHGLTPSRPTKPARTTLGGIHVLASKRRTATTGADARPSVACVGPSVRPSLRARGAAARRAADGSGMRSGRMTSASGVISAL